MARARLSAIETFPSGLSICDTSRGKSNSQGSSSQAQNPTSTRCNKFQIGLAIDTDRQGGLNLRPTCLGVRRGGCNCGGAHLSYNTGIMESVGKLKGKYVNYQRSGSQH